MNQLLIVKPGTSLNAKEGGGSVTPYTLKDLAKGAITLFELGASSVLATAPTKNFAIAVGKGSQLPPFVIPEVDVDTLTIEKCYPKKATPSTITIVAANVNAAQKMEYSLMLVKKNTVPHERNTWSVSYDVRHGETITTNEVLAKLSAQLEAKTANLPITVSYTSGTRTLVITGTDTECFWEVVLGGGFGSHGAPDSHTVNYTDGTTVNTPAVNPAIGDKAFILKLAQRCAGGKGFNYLDNESRDIYPGYPEAVEDFTLNTTATGNMSSVGYALYSLHFATGRAAGKQTDERVWQYVYIAVPITYTESTVGDILEDILPVGKFNPIQQVAAKGYLTKTAADALYAAKQ